MRVAMYSPAGHPLQNHLQRVFRDLGHKPLVRDSRRWRGETEDCDVVVVQGYRYESRALAEHYAKHVPVIIHDWGYFARVNAPSQRYTGHWQLSLNRLNVLPDFECPPDRFKATKVKLNKKFGGDKNGYVLVIGQMFNDAAVLDHDHVRWLKAQLATYRARGLDVHYRRHPRSDLLEEKGKLDGETSLDGPLDEVLAGARFIVSWNSNVGHEALLAGVPVVSGPLAAYASLSGEELPSYERRLEYFSRAAYGQWLWDEMQDGVKFVLDDWIPRSMK